MIGVADDVRGHVDQTEEGGADDLRCSLSLLKKKEESKEENDSNHKMELPSPVRSRAPLAVEDLMLTELQSHRLRSLSLQHHTITCIPGVGTMCSGICSEWLNLVWSLSMWA